MTIAKQTVQAVVAGRTLRVDGRDVAAWRGSAWSPDRPPNGWDIEDYVEAHPRPALGAARVAASQRLVLMRRLAAGPASTADLLAALRQVGWVGASDLENRLREVSGLGGRGALGLPMVKSGGRYELTEPFASLNPSDRSALAFAKSVLNGFDSPLAAAAVDALDRLIPAVPPEHGLSSARTGRAGRSALHRLEDSRRSRVPVEVRYWSLNSRTERGYRLVPVRYAMSGPAVKALCVEIDERGRRRAERQLALDRIISVAIPEGEPVSAKVLELRHHALRIIAAERLAKVVIGRGLLGVTDESARQVDADEWELEGSFPDAEKWDVLEQLCAWAGSVQVVKPLWLVSAVTGRLRAGLAVMEGGASFALVTPDDHRKFEGLGDAVFGTPLAPEGPTVLRPPPDVSRRSEGPR